MNTILETYLETIDKHLKPLPTSERVDIVKEIKSSILEMENDQIPTEQILERLGAPKDLAKAYLGDLISQSKGFSRKRFLTLCAFYSVVGFSGLFVIPILAVLGPSLIICGALAPFLGAVKMINYIFHLGIPYMEDVGIVMHGLVEFNPVVEFILSLFVGIFLYWAGHRIWDLLRSYIKKVSTTKKNLSI